MHSQLRQYTCLTCLGCKMVITIGEMVEWSITTVLKTVVLRGTGGSNPSLSAKWLQDDFKMVVKTAFKISVNRCKTYTYNDFSLYISLHSDG